MRDVVYYIAPIENIDSIMGKGIYCHNKAKGVKHVDRSEKGVQNRRQIKRIPGGGKLHDFVNLYFDAHNPMLSRLREFNKSLCILKIVSDVVKLPETVLSDRNAAADLVRFFYVHDGKRNLDFKKIYDQYWIHEDERETIEHKSIKCAEILIKDMVDSKYILGAIVIDEEVKEQLLQTGFNLPIEVDSRMFFRGIL